MGAPKVPWHFRFWIKVKPVESGCWEWQAGRDEDGYGQFGPTHGHCLRAPKFAYQQFVGDVPDGLIVMHTCDNPPCVRPDHLRLGTYAENTADMFRKGRHPGNGYREKTHCKNGHPLSGENLEFQGAGHRKCRTCRRLTQNRYDARQRTIVKVFPEA